MRAGLVWIALLLAAAVFAQDKRAKPKPDTVERAADKVLAAFKAKDETCATTRSTRSGSTRTTGRLGSYGGSRNEKEIL